jgi:hypothetical protein
MTKNPRGAVRSTLTRMSDPLHGLRAANRRRRAQPAPPVDESATARVGMLSPGARSEPPRVSRRVSIDDAIREAFYTGRSRQRWVRIDP